MYANRKTRIVSYTLHHMYAVGLDVDTTRVSFLNVNSVIIIWLFAVNFLSKFACPKTVDGIIKQTYITSKEQSAGNFVNQIDEMSTRSISEHFAKHNKPKTESDKIGRAHV